MNVAAIILAAGGSVRMGRPKQLMPVHGEALLHRTARIALASQASSVIVVLGAQAGACGSEIADLPVRLALNPVWRDGMASSIVAGVNEARRKDPDLDAVILMACDQPHLTAGVLDELLATYELEGKGMVACRYAGTAGVPALFARRWFGALERLEGESGAKSLLKATPEDLACVAFEGGRVDIDTLKDYARFLAASPSRNEAAA